MPIFEFECKECGDSFEELVRNNEAIAEVVCPECGGKQVRKKVSKIAAKVSGLGGFSFSPSSAASCNTGST